MCIFSLNVGISWGFFIISYVGENLEQGQQVQSHQKLIDELRTRIENLMNDKEKMKEGKGVFII